jgi:2-dehydropantoate 2-reductase
MTAVTRSNMGVIRSHAGLMAMMDAALDEAMAVGRARGVTFPDKLVEGTMEMVRNFPAGSKSSMLEDLERGRRLELPWLSGAIHRMGREMGVPTPTHTFIANVLAPFENGR